MVSARQRIAKTKHCHTFFLCLSERYCFRNVHQAPIRLCRTLNYPSCKASVSTTREILEGIIELELGSPVCVKFLSTGISSNARKIMSLRSLDTVYFNNASSSFQQIWSRHQVIVNISNCWVLPTFFIELFCLYLLSI